MHRLDTLYREWTESGRQNPDALLREIIKIARAIVWSRAPRHADEIAQETAVYCWKHLAQFDPAKSSLTGWVRLKSNATLNDHLAWIYRSREIFADGIEIDQIDYAGDHEGLSTQAYERLRIAFGDQKPLLDLLIAGYSMTECESLLGLSRKAIRYQLEKIKKAAASATGTNPGQLRGFEDCESQRAA
ncbi:sigma factor [Tunturiibacter gelidiferens]|uniref:sigma factor n=1 Tax=Tunturiibacter gelidiferens TaxID=3069689 RepID=UPI003D9B1313